MRDGVAAAEPEPGDRHAQVGEPGERRADDEVRLVARDRVCALAGDVDLVPRAITSSGTTPASQRQAEAVEPGAEVGAGGRDLDDDGVTGRERTHAGAYRPAPSNPQARATARTSALTTSASIGPRLESAVSMSLRP